MGGLRAVKVSRDHPVVISKYITGAKEVEMDGIGKAGDAPHAILGHEISRSIVFWGEGDVYYIAMLQ